jgi:hypothetical protein
LGALLSGIMVATMQAPASPTSRIGADYPGR